jgi:hypothetical protein
LPVAVLVGVNFITLFSSLAPLFQKLIRQFRRKKAEKSLRPTTVPGGKLKILSILTRKTNHPTSLMTHPGQPMRRFPLSSFTEIIVLQVSDSLKNFFDAIR